MNLEELKEELNNPEWVYEKLSFFSMIMSVLTLVTISFVLIFNKGPSALPALFFCALGFSILMIIFNLCDLLIKVERLEELMEK